MIKVTLVQTDAFEDDWVEHGLLGLEGAVSYRWCVMVNDKIWSSDITGSERQAEEVKALIERAYNLGLTHYQEGE